MSDEDTPLEFSARDLMPDWAQESKGDTSRTSSRRFDRDDDDKKRGDRKGGRGRGGKDFGDRRGSDRRGSDRRGGGGDRRGGNFRGGDRRGGGGPGGERGGRGNFDRRGGDRRGGGGRGRGDDRSGGGRGRFEDRERLPEGIKAELQPSAEAVAGLVKHIKETCRCFPISDIAKMVVRERERYNVKFSASDKKKMYQCEADKSLWLTKEEALSHILNSPAVEKYYQIEEVDVGAPSGNFAQVAVCGMSGTILGPPNHHEYQRNVAKLHQERFSNMSLERFKSRIRMENEEEVIEKWKEQVSKKRHFKVRTEEEAPAKEEVAATEEAVTQEDPVASEESETPTEESSAAPIEESSTEEVEAEEPPTEEEAADPESSAEEAVDETAEEQPSPEPTPQLEAEDVAVLKSPEELAQHFRTTFAQEAIAEVNQAVVPGNISGRDLSAGLLGHLKQEGEKLRRSFPLPMIQALCREFEKHGLRFFKRGKKALHVSGVRPKALSATASLTDQVQAIVDHVLEKPGTKVVDLLDALVEEFSKPEKSAPTEEIPLPDAAKAVLKDLRWLTSEGYVLEFPDSKLMIGKAPRKEGEGEPAAKKSATKKKAKRKRTRKSRSRKPVATSPQTSQVDPLVEIDSADQDPYDTNDLPDSVDPVEVY